MPVKAKAAAKATARTRPTIAGLQAEVARLKRELTDLQDRYVCNTAIMHARTDSMNKAMAQRDAAWAHLGRLWEATGGEQGDRKAETREELLGWGVDDAIKIVHEHGEALKYATRLCESLAGYYATALGWKPEPELMGVLSQIDNMTMGLIAQRDEAIKERDELRQTIRDVEDQRDMELNSRLAETQRADELADECDAQHERERAACWGCRISAYWRSLRG